MIYKLYFENYFMLRLNTFTVTFPICRGNISLPILGTRIGNRNSSLW